MAHVSEVVQTDSVCGTHQIGKETKQEAENRVADQAKERNWSGTGKRCRTNVRHTYQKPTPRYFKKGHTLVNSSIFFPQFNGIKAGIKQ